MTDRELLELAKEAGAIKRYWGEGKEGFAFQSDEQLEAFAALVRAEREWVDLTDDEIEQWVDALPYDPDELHLTRFAREVIAAFKEKNK